MNSNQYPEFELSFFFGGIFKGSELIEKAFIHDESENEIDCNVYPNEHHVILCLHEDDTLTNKNGEKVHWVSFEQKKFGFAETEEDYFVIVKRELDNRGLKEFNNNIFKLFKESLIDQVNSLVKSHNELLEPNKRDIEMLDKADSFNEFLEKLTFEDYLKFNEFPGSFQTENIKSLIDQLAQRLIRIEDDSRLFYAKYSKNRILDSTDKKIIHQASDLFKARNPELDTHYFQFDLTTIYKAKYFFNLSEGMDFLERYNSLNFPLTDLLTNAEIEIKERDNIIKIILEKANTWSISEITIRELQIKMDLHIYDQESRMIFFRNIIQETIQSIENQQKDLLTISDFYISHLFENRKLNTDYETLNSLFYNSSRNGVSVLKTFKSLQNYIESLKLLEYLKSQINLSTPNEDLQIGSRNTVNPAASVSMRNVSEVIDILEPFIEPAQFDDFKHLLNTFGNASQKILFKDAGNRLTDMFKKLIDNDFITGTNKKDLNQWICSNFKFLKNGEQLDFKTKTVESIISSEQNFCKNPIIMVKDGAIVRIFKNNK